MFVVLVRICPSANFEIWFENVGGKMPFSHRPTAYLLARKCTTINVNLTNNQPNLVISIQNCKMLSLVDTGSFFSILPSKHFQQLNIPSEYLDKSKNYSIQSATNLVNNAVQGTIHLSVDIDNVNGTKQKLNQRFLILRPDLSLTLPLLLLGSDFLRANKSVIQYDVEKISLVLSNVHVCTISNNEPLQCTNAFLTAPPMSRKTPKMSQNGKNTFKINDQSSIENLGCKIVRAQKS
jgi:hypothetical protein